MKLLRRYQLANDRSVTVANLVDELLRRNGDCEVGMEDSGPWHLAQLHAEITAIDSYLRSVVKISPAQPVAIYRTNDRRCFRWFLAIIRAGGIAVPLNPQLSLPEVSRILAESGTQVLVTDHAVFSSTIKDRANLPTITTWVQADESPDPLPGFLYFNQPESEIAATFPTSAPSFTPVNIDPTATIAIFHTSGTSGFPKGAALSSNALLGARASTVAAGLFLGPKDLALIALPWSHIMAVSIALYGLMAGIRGCFLNHFDTDRAINLVQAHRITAVVGVPAMFARLVNSHPRPAALATLRVWLSASDHLPTDVRTRLREYGALFQLPGLRIPPVILNGYGMVELGGLAMMGIETSLFPGSGDLCFPVPPFKIRIADQNNHPVPTGATGECQVRRPGLKPHYWNQKDESSNPSPDNENLLTPDGWLRTGDLATRNRLGLIRLVGRIKDVIKSGGYSVYVRELEEALSAHPAVARAAAFGLPHSEKGEVPAAAVEIKPDNTLTEAALIDFCRQRLANYKVPRRIWLLATGDLPQNNSGKVLRRTLREKYSNAI